MRKRIFNARFALLAIVLLGSVALVACTGSRGWPSPTISDDTLYVGSTTGNLLAIDTANRNVVLWTWSPKSKQSGGGFFSCASGGALTAGNVYGAPTVHNGLIYVGAFDGNVYAIEPTSDNRDAVTAWKYKAGSQIVGGVAVSDDGTIFAGTSDGTLVALDANANGLEKWKFPREGAIGKIWTTPTVVDGVVYFGSLDHNLYALDAVTGDLKWSKPFETGGAIVAQPLVVEGVVYFGSFDSKFYAVDAATGDQKWVFDKATNWYWAKAFYEDGYVYAGSLDKNVYAMNAADGTQRWAVPVGTGGPVRSSPVVAGGILVVASEDARVYFRNAADGSQRWAPIELDAKPLSDLAISGSLVYLTTEDNSVHIFDAEIGRPFSQPISLGE